MRTNLLALVIISHKHFNRLVLWKKLGKEIPTLTFTVKHV